MYKKDQIVVYRYNVCKITGILPKYRNDEDYYYLRGTFDTSLLISTPMSLADQHIRLVIEPSEAQALIDDTSLCSPISTEGDAIQRVCETHIAKGLHWDMLRVIKARHLPQDADNKPYYKWSERDKTAFRRAEKIFYRELSMALGQTVDTVKQAIHDRIRATQLSAQPA